jgi:flagellar hook assembly protein FlgD
VTIPAVHALLQNQPNPFRPGTEIRYQLASAAAVRLAVFDAQGRQVRTLVDGTVAAGHHRVAWDGRDAHGRAVPSGLYFYRLVAGAFTATRKMALSR